MARSSASPCDLDQRLARARRNTAGNSDPSNDCLPTAAYTHPLVAAYWDHMQTAVGSTGTKGFAYQDKALTPDGGFSLKLREGAIGKAQIQFAARGAALAMPDLTALTGPVTVQVQNGNGFCWEAVYGGPPLTQTAEQ